MKVYTRTGDKGETSLFNGCRVPKDHVLVDAYGTVDECNSAIGLATSYLTADSMKHKEDDLISDLQTLVKRLNVIQQYMFDLGAHLATPQKSSSKGKVKRTQFPAHASEQLEQWIDDFDLKLSPLTSFILPGGHPSASALHLSRTIARRAERCVTPLFRADDAEIDSTAYHFLNRLSDFLFVAARIANQIMGVNDHNWSRIADDSQVRSPE